MYSNNSRANPAVMMSTLIKCKISPSFHDICKQAVYDVNGEVQRNWSKTTVLKNYGKNLRNA